MNYKIAIWDQHTASAGRWARGWDADTDAQSDDYMVYEGSREQILADADAADELASLSGAGNDIFWKRVARSLRQAVE